MIINKKHPVILNGNKINKSYFNNKEVVSFAKEEVVEGLNINISYENQNFYLNLEGDREKIDSAMDKGYNIILIPRWKKSKHPYITIPKEIEEVEMGIDITSDIQNNNFKIEYNQLKTLLFFADKNQKSYLDYGSFGRFSNVKFLYSYAYTFFDFIIIGTPRPVYERAKEYERLLLYGSEEKQDLHNLKFEFRFLLKNNYKNINEINFSIVEKIIICN